jgi:hypothetical protein
MKTWYFTFGMDHPLHPGKCQPIQADTEVEARSEMFRLYGGKWCASYSEDYWDRVKNNPKRCWPMEEELPTVKAEDIELYCTDCNESFYWHQVDLRTVRTVWSQTTYEVQFMCPKCGCLVSK